MIISRYGLDWEIDPNPVKGQEGLLAEDHYRQLFKPSQVSSSFADRDVWLDIGANIGAFALRAAKDCAEVIAVEPEPENLQYLRRNIELNGFSNVEVAPYAIVGHHEKTVPLALSNSYSSTHRVGSIRGRKSINVPAKHINEVLFSSTVNKIKIDAEGSEAEILEAANLSGIDEIVFEYHFSFLKDYDWSRFNAILEKLKREGFELRQAPKAKSKTWHTIVWATR